MSRASSTCAHSLISTRAPLPRNPSSNPLLATLNSLLQALELPLSLSTIATATPSLLLTILESILQRRFPIINSTLRGSWERKDRIYIVKFLLGKIGELTGGGEGWEGIDFSKVARGEEEQVGRVVEALIGVARNEGVRWDEQGTEEGWEKESLGMSGRSEATSSGSGSTARRTVASRDVDVELDEGNGHESTWTPSISSSPSSRISLRSLNLGSSTSSTSSHRRTLGQRNGVDQSESQYKESTSARSMSPPASVHSHIHIYSDDDDDPFSQTPPRPKAARQKSKSKSPIAKLVEEAEEVGKCPCIERGGTVVMSSISAEISDEESCIHFRGSEGSTPRSQRRGNVARSTTSTRSNASSTSTTTRSRSSIPKMTPSADKRIPPLSPSLSNISPPRSHLPRPQSTREHSKSLNPITDSDDDDEEEYHASAAKIPYITRPHFTSDDDASSVDSREGLGGGGERGSSSESSSGDTVVLLERRERLMMQLEELRAGEDR